jgi:formylglycine-generating enzyme required for sulfatase activity
MLKPMKKPNAAGACCQPGAHVAAPDRKRQMKIESGGSYSGSMVAVPEGWFRMGADNSPHPEDGEAPERDVFLTGFALAATTVTIEAYAAFVDATGYRTEAERNGSSFVFYAQCDPSGAFAAPVHAPWWRQVPGACWHSPNGPAQAAPDASHPVTHVTRLDALAYCHWSGTRLPTEAEWEYAARGKLQGQPFPWGDELEPQGTHQANIWQGEFPDKNTGADGYTGTAPAMSFPAHGFGHFNMVGNVWEWMSDRFTTQHSPRPVKNPAGPLNGSQFVAKGGSYLCHASYCTRYRTSSRQALSPDTSAGNIGFRVATDKV